MSMNLGTPKWYPTRPFVDFDDKVEPFGLIILNGDVKCSCRRNTVKRFWKAAAIKIAADGASNLLYDMTNDKFSLCPDVMCGDLDSISDEARMHFEAMGSEVVKIASQSVTDFTKSVDTMFQMASRKKISLKSIYTVGGLCGRFDHIFGCMESLTHCSYLFVALRIVVVSPSNGEMSHIYRFTIYGQHTVSIDQSVITGKCGLIPIGNRVSSIFTTGLQWNLKGEQLAFGTLVSTSNEVKCDVVNVCTSDPVLFTMELEVSSINLETE
ncbi:Thiamin pyrophosphokinase 1, partial [Trichinella sp. T6]